MNKKYYKSILYIINIILVLAWVLILKFTKNLIKGKQLWLDILIYLLPILFIIYHINIQLAILNKSKSIKEERNKISKLLKKDLAVAKTIPIMIFGIGIILSKANKEYILISLPYLLLALIFGTVIPFVISMISFKESNLTKLIISENVFSSSESFSFALLIPAIFYPLFLVLKKK